MHVLEEMHQTQRINHEREASDYKKKVQEFAEENMRTIEESICWGHNMYNKK